MSGASTKQSMDIFSAYMDVPFDVAAYCRGHRHCPEAVNLMRAIKKRQDADQRLKSAELCVEIIRNVDFANALIDIREKMERDPK